MNTPRETLETVKKEIVKQFQDNEHRMSFDDMALLGKLDYLIALGRQEALEEIREDVKAIEYARISGYSMVNRDQVISSIDKASSLQSPKPSKKL
jgi:hypothetical protein